jgi:hypothetical protein
MIDSALKKAVLSVLRPLVRYMIERGWTYPALSEMLKAVYVEEALQRQGEENDSVTDSRVSLLTGVHRKDVKRLRAVAGDHAAELPHAAALAARVVAAWTSSPRYLDTNRKPKILPQRHMPNRVSFEGLVREAKADMRANVILDELVRAGVADVDEEGKVHLLRSAYVSDIPRDKLVYLGDNVSDHLKGALHNVTGKGKPFLERAVYYEVMDAQELDEVRPELYQLSEEFLQAINRRVMPLNRRANQHGQTGRRRMRLGVYYFEDDSRVSAPVKRREKSKRGKHE